MGGNESIHEKIDELLQAWRQGDCVVGDEHWFLQRTHVEAPLTPEGEAASIQGMDVVETEVFGFIVLSQTCDIVRSCSDRPFVEVSPLVKISPQLMHEVERFQRPRYAYAPGASSLGLVADLDRVMTVEKSVVARWKRTRGCQDDADSRRLALALTRKRARFAFPDDFAPFVDPLRKRLSSKHDKNSPEGRALRALQEIRVSAHPSWDAPQVSLTFWFIHNEEQPVFEGESWVSWLDKWMKLLPPGTRFKPEGLRATLAELRAADYLGSDPLDLDHLSHR